MPAARFWLALALPAAIGASACGAAPSSRGAPVATEPRRAAPTEQASEEPPVPFELADDCAVRLPRGRSGGVLGVAVVDRIHESAEGPLSFALCGCVRPGPDVIDVRATVLPERGEVRAWTGREGLDRCLDEALTLAGFRPWRLGSDCVDCGPRRMRWPSAIDRVRVIEPEPESSVTFLVRFGRGAR